ncbi:MAG: preprotein translocase subunit SecG [Clostridia bacterium]|nr:preprotein translocase subunit SecG [Clostridia bacterium]
MSAFQIVMGIVQIILCIAVVLVVLLQSSKNSRVSGTIMGGAETFFGKSKAKDMDSKLSTITAILAGAIALISVLMLLIK